MRTYFDKPLIAALKRAHRELGARGLLFAKPTPDLSAARGLGDPYLRRLTQLAFLAPDIQQEILAGRQPPGLTLKRLMQDDVPIAWSAQRERFGFECPSAGAEL